MSSSPKILVIDTDQRSGKTIRNFLSSQGYDVCYANNGALGIEKTFEYNPDLVLCSIKMEPIDGYQVFKAIKNNTMMNYAPFIFFSDSPELKDFRLGMNLGADDYFIKPISNDDLLKSIQNQLHKFKKLKESGKQEFNALFNLSPNGIFLFDKASLIDANPSLLHILEIKKEDIKKLTIEDIFEATSFQHIKDKMQRFFNGFDNQFFEYVILKSKNGLKREATLCISVYENSSKSPLMIGLVIVHDNHTKRFDNEQKTTEILKMLKNENITISNSLGGKLTNIFNQQNVNITRQNLDLFSKRENEVLNLSMEGLPMKLIANKLSISDRTVEKHRAKLMEKTGSNNIVEVIVYAIRNNLVAVRILLLFFLPEAIFF